MEDEEVGERILFIGLQWIKDTTLPLLLILVMLRDFYFCSLQ